MMHYWLEIFVGGVPPHNGISCPLSLLFGNAAEVGCWPRKRLRPLSMIIWAIMAIKPSVYVARTRGQEYIVIVWRGDIVVGKPGMKGRHTSIKWPERSWVHTERPLLLMLCQTYHQLRLKSRKSASTNMVRAGGISWAIVDENSIWNKWLRNIPKKWRITIYHEKKAGSSGAEKKQVIRGV